MTKRIGILTGGGDVPGLNSVIKEVVYRGTENNCEIYGIRRSAINERSRRTGHDEERENREAGHCETMPAELPPGV